MVPSHLGREIVISLPSPIKLRLTLGTALATSIERMLPPVLFAFQNPGLLCDDELQVVLIATRDANGADVEAPTYCFSMRRADAAQPVGHLNLRLGHSPNLELYQGHIGYGVLARWRGNHYAERATRLIMPLAKVHEFDPLWITADPDNWPSRRTCERLGAVLIEILDVPKEALAYRHGARRKCRYRLDL